MAEKLFGLSISVNLYARSEAHAQRFQDKLLDALRGVAEGRLEEFVVSGVSSVDSAEEIGHIEELE